MKMLWILITGLGVVLLGGPLGLPVATAQMPDAPEPGEVEIITPTLPSVGDIVGRFSDPAVREVEVRGLTLTREQVNDAFLSTDPARNVLTQVGSQLRPGQEVDFRTVDGQRFRVQNEEGELRVRLRDAVVQNREALATFFSDAGIGRVEIRGVDADGNRVRLEVRDGVVKKDEVKADRGGGRGREGTSASINNERATDRGRDLDHSIRGRDRAELERERAGRSDRPERRERAERPDRSSRSGRN